MAFYIFLIQKKQNYISMLKDSVTKRTKTANSFVILFTLSHPFCNKTDNNGQKGAVLVQ